jgi:hypothetical protein
MSHQLDIEELINRVVDGGVDGLYEIAVEVLEGAKANIGVGDPELDPNIAVSLRESGRIVKSGAGWIIVFETPYAAKQHEAQGFKHPRGGGAKFLEKEVIQKIPQIEGVVASAVRANVLGGSERSHKRGGNRGRPAGPV